MIDIQEAIRLIDRNRKTLEAVRSEHFQNVIKKYHTDDMPHKSLSSIYAKLLTLEHKMNYLDSLVQNAKDWK